MLRKILLNLGSLKTLCVMKDYSVGILKLHFLSGCSMMLP